MDPDSSQPLVHLELHTGDLARACSFMAEVFGWRPERVEAAGSSYWALELGGRFAGGGIVECETEQPLWLPYVEVAEISAATERARRFGAEVSLEPREGPGGWRSVVAAEGCAEVALWQSKSAIGVRHRSASWRSRST